MADRVAGHGDAALAAATPRDSGRILRRHRRLAGWTQEELAHRAGLSVRAIRDFEAGRVRRPHGQTIRLLTEALDLTEASRRELQSMIRAARHVNGSAAAADGLGGPCQLPRDVADFTGRWETLAKVREHLTTARGGTPTSVPVCVIAGMAGVGKTTLAVHLAHQLRAQFRDGQYFVDLHGTGASPLDADDVLGRLLWPLGLHSVPGDVDQLATMWRVYLAGRRALVVLDDVATEAQIRQVLPGTPGCAVLITSRTRLAGLDGAKLIGLDLLPADQMLQLLARIAGPDRIGSQRAAAEAVVRFCAGLPLAARLAGARLAARPHWSAQRLVELLADERRRLDELAIGDQQVRASVARSYRALGDRERRAFRLLGLLDAADFTPSTAAGLLGGTVADAREALERLVDAHLLRAVPDHSDHGRYRFHDLVRTFARERLRSE